MSSPEALPPRHPDDERDEHDPTPTADRPDWSGRRPRGRGARRRRPGSETSESWGPFAMAEEPRRGRRGGSSRGPDTEAVGFDPGVEPGRRGPGHSGRGHHHGGGRGRGPRPRRGDVRLAILRLLADEPMHGYQIMTELADRSGGVWRVSPGSVYPTLQAMADEGLVASEDSEGRRVFALTEDGRAAVASSQRRGQEPPWVALARGADGATMRLREAVGPLMAAASQVAQVGTPDQVSRAEELLAEARRALYRLLAEDTSSPADTAPSEESAGD